MMGKSRRGWLRMVGTCYWFHMDEVCRPDNLGILGNHDHLSLVCCHYYTEISTSINHYCILTALVYSFCRQRFISSPARQDLVCEVALQLSSDWLELLVALRAPLSPPRGVANSSHELNVLVAWGKRGKMRGKKHNFLIVIFQSFGGKKHLQHLHLPRAGIFLVPSGPILWHKFVCRLG